MESQDFSLYSGDSMQLPFSIVDEDSTPVDLTGGTVKWVLVNGTVTILSKSIGNGITITNAAQGKGTVFITPADTQALLGDYTHQARAATAGGGDSKIVFYGTVTVNKSFV